MNDQRQINLYQQVAESEQLTEVFKQLPNFKLMSFDDLLDESIPPTDWIVNGLLARGTTSILSGLPKLGKSTLVRYLLFCAAHNLDFFGRKTKLAKVLYFATEEIPYEIQCHNKKMVVATGITSRGSITTVFGHPNHQNPLRDLEEAIKQTGADLVIIDPLVLWMNNKVKDINSYNESYAFINLLNELAAKYNCHILTVHHSNKNDGDQFSKILGSTAIPAAIFTLIVLYEDLSGNVIFETRQKAGERFKNSQITYEAESGVFALKNAPLSDLKAEKTERVLRVISEFGPMIEEEIWQKVPGKIQTRKVILDDLLNKALIVRNGAGKRNAPFVYSTPGEQGSTNSMADPEANSLVGEPC